jgi:hypothetical protein
MVLEQLSQFKDNSQYSMLLHLVETYVPQEILLPHTMEASSLCTQLQSADHGFIRCSAGTACSCFEKTAFKLLKLHGCPGP